MKPSTLSKTIEIISAIFILLFVYTATSKLWSHHSFLSNLRSSPLIGFAGSILSWTIPLVELLISVLLFIPALRRIGLIGAFVLMTVFTGYIAFMLIASPNLPCSCGGVIAKLSWEEHLWLNIILTALAAAGIVLNKLQDFIAIKQAKPKTCKPSRQYFIN